MAFEKELLIDVFESYYYQMVAGKRKLVFMSQNMTSTGISNSQTETEVRNGAGNGLFATLSGQKDVTVKLSENVFSFEFLSMMTGSNIITAAGVGITSPQNFTVGATKKVTLSETPITSSEIEIYEGSTLIASAGYTISAKDITFTTQPTKAITVMPYKYATADTAKTITVSGDTFAQGGELWLKGVIKDNLERAKAYVWFVFPNVKPTGSFDINTASEKQAQEMSVEMKVLKDSSNNLYSIHRQELL